MFVKSFITQATGVISDLVSRNLYKIRRYKLSHSCFRLLICKLRPQKFNKFLPRFPPSCQNLPPTRWRRNNGSSFSSSRSKTLSNFPSYLRRLRQTDKPECFIDDNDSLILAAGNTKGGSITVPPV
jgi:hypothetical protein